MTKYEALTEALIKAKEYAEQYKGTEDGGTCNLDAPTINSWKGCKKSLVIEAVKAAGLSCWEWSGWGQRRLVICGGTCGQGNMRSRMAEAMWRSLEASGIDAGLYCQAD